MKRRTEDPTLEIRRRIASLNAEMPRLEQAVDAGEDALDHALLACHDSRPYRSVVRTAHAALSTARHCLELLEADLADHHQQQHRAAAAPILKSSEGKIAALIDRFPVPDLRTHP